MIYGIKTASSHELDGRDDDGSYRIYNHQTSQYEWVRDEVKNNEIIVKRYSPTRKIIVDENGVKYRVYRRSLDSNAKAWGSADTLRPKKTSYHHSWEYYNPK